MASRRYAILPDRLALQLSEVGRSGGLYYPCEVTLADGSCLDCVYLSDADDWYVQWGIWPEEDRGKRSIDLLQIASLRQSPSSLPAKFADQLYDSGESGMGYTIFTIEFEDGSRQAYGYGNAIDFVCFPPGQSRETVARVFPHLGRDDNPITGPDYYWCLYESA